MGQNCLMQKILYPIFFLFIVSCSISLPQAETEVKCLNYEPEKVQLTGLLYSKSFPGPPNYEDIKKGDEEEIYWLIKTEKEFCVNETKNQWAGKLMNQSEVQLVMNSNFNFYKKKRFLLNRKVIIQGTLFPPNDRTSQNRSSHYS